MNIFNMLIEVPFQEALEIALITCKVSYFHMDSFVMILQTVFPVGLVVTFRTMEFTTIVMNSFYVLI